MKQNSENNDNKEINKILKNISPENINYKIFLENISF